MGKQILVYYHGQIITMDEELLYAPYFAKKETDTVSKEDKDEQKEKES